MQAAGKVQIGGFVIVDINAAQRGCLARLGLGIDRGDLLIPTGTSHAALFLDHDQRGLGRCDHRGNRKACGHRERQESSAQPHRKFTC